MRKLDYEGLSDAELQQVLERSTAQYEAGPDTRRAARRARLSLRLIPTRRFFRTQSEASAGHARDVVLASILFTGSSTAVLQATLDLRWMVALSVPLAVLGGVAATRYRQRANAAAQRAAGVRQSDG